MLKNSDKYDTSTHFTYKEYRKNVKQSPNRDIMIFSSVFLVGVLIILGFAKILSPNVDVAISINDEETSTLEDDGNSSTVIDERLRRIQMEDEGKKTSDGEMFSPELDEKVILPQQKRKTVGEIEAEKNNLSAINKEETTEKPTEAKSTDSHNAKPQVNPPSQPEQTVNAKVVVGYYATEKQAEVAKTIIHDAGLNITPVVKNLGGYYTLQVGAYSSKEKAQQAANNLLKSNFPARVIIE